MIDAALFDTSALIDVVDLGVVATLPFERVFVSSLTYAELRMGLATASTLDVFRGRSRRIEAIARHFGRGLPFDDECALAYERVVQISTEHGRGARSNTLDRMIASVAIANDLALITSNPSDLKGLEEALEIVGI